MDRKQKEAIRYLGYGRNAADARTLALIAESFQELQAVVSQKHVCRLFCLNEPEKQVLPGSGKAEEGHIFIENLEIYSKSLAKNLKGCDQVLLFGATLGIGVDQLIARASLTDMAKAVVLQACAAAQLEEYCDECQAEIGGELKKEGRYLRPRFSPGYGDFSIEYQQNLMQMLDCAKKIGLTMTDSFMMSPSKSVTAVIGVSTLDTHCHRMGCEICEKKDCLYRRDTG